MGKPSSKPALRGAPTVHEIRSAIKQLCDRYSYDPFEELIKLAMGEQPISVDDKIVMVPICTVDQKIMIAKEIAPYLASKLKTMEVVGEIDHKVEISIRKVGGKSEELLNAIEINQGGSATDTQRILAEKVIEPKNKMKDVLGEITKKSLEDED